MLRTELPKPLEDLFDDLGSIGITEPMNNITLSKDSQYNIRLYSDSILGQAVIERLTERDDLAALNSLCGQLYKGFDDAFKAEIINESKKEMSLLCMISVSFIQGINLTEWIK